MTDEQLNEYPPHIAALLDDARPIDAAPASAKADVRARVLATVGATATAASVATAAQVAPATANAPGAAAGWLGAKGLWLAVGVGVIGIAIALFRATKDDGASESNTHNQMVAAAPDARPASMSVPSSPIAVALASDAQSAAALTDDASAQSVALADAAAPSRIAPPADTLGEEQRLLDRARAALASGEHDAALSALVRHKQRFSRGQLAMERDALEVRALLAAGREDEARAAATRFGSRWPSSPLRSAVEAMLR